MDTLYTPESISDYESIWGRGFVSPGGLELSQELIGSLGLEAGDTVLDVGCGLGGSAFLMAERFGLRVVGIDSSANMMSQAKERCHILGLDNRVEFLLADCLSFRREKQFDAVYSRDVFLHIHDKKTLFENLFANLCDAGTLLFTDYCCGPKPWSKPFENYVDRRRYSLHTLEEYSDLVRMAGFCDLVSFDWTSKFVESLESDLDRMSQQNSSVELKGAWRAKLVRAQGREQRWAMIRACRPPGEEKVCRDHLPEVSFPQESRVDPPDT